MTRSLTNSLDGSSTLKTIDAPTSAGFASGELIYNQNGNFGTIPNSAATTAGFNIVNNQSSATGATGGTANWSGTLGGSRTRSYAAVLTNGNIVQVYNSFNTNAPFFNIVDTNNTQVVAPTTISNTYNNVNGQSNIAVAALSGGGFAVSWISDNYPCFAVYSNTGAIVTAPFQDATVTTATTNSMINLAAQPNGGFVFGYTDTSSILSTRTYNAVGTSTAPWLNVSGGSYAPGIPNQFDIAVRSDSSFIVVWSIQTAGKYRIMNALNVALIGVATYSSALAASNLYNSSVCVLANDTFVIGYCLSLAGASWAFKPLPISNVLGSETVLPIVGLYALQSGVRSVILRSFSSKTKFIFMFCDSLQRYKYCVYNDSLALLSGSAPGTLYSSANYDRVSPTIIENNGWLNVYWTQDTYDALSKGQSYSQISKSTYTVRSFGSSTDKIVGAGSAAVNGYSRSASTPSKACFLAAASGGINVTGALSTNVATTVVDELFANSLSCAVFPDGRFAIAYTRQNISPYIAKVAIYSASGSLLTNITLPANAQDNSSGGAIQVTCLSSNKFVVGVHTASSTVSLYVYGSDYVLAAPVITRTRVSISAGTDRFCLNSLTNDRYVLTFVDTDTGYPSYVVLNSSNTILQNITAAYGVASFSNISSSSHQQGFVMGGYYNAGVKYIFNIMETSAGSWSLVGGPASAGSTQGPYGAGAACSPNGEVFWLGSDSGTAMRMYSYTPTMSQQSSFTYDNLVNNTTTCWLINTCVASSGNGVTIRMDAGANPPVQMLTFPINMYPQGVYTSLPVGTVVTLSGVSLPNSSTLIESPAPCMAALDGPNILLAWKNVNKYPCFAIINTLNWTYSAVTEAGVTASTGAVNLAPSNGYVFQGVSITAAAAGSVGKVQTNGLALLNDNYSASTPASSFDFQQPNGSGIDGSKGTMVGKVVNLTGNN